MVNGAHAVPMSDVTESIWPKKIRCQVYLLIRQNFKLSGNFEAVLESWFAAKRPSWQEKQR